MKYTKEDFLKAAELGEVSMIDARHIVSLLDEVTQLPQQEKTLSDKWKEYQDWLNEIPEISDEEIEKAAAHHEPMVTRRAWVSACKWYREQLKQRQ